MGILSNVNMISNFLNNTISGISSMFESPKTEEEQKKNEDQLKYANENINIKQNNLLSDIKNFIPNILKNSFLDLANGGKTNYTEQMIDKTPIIGDIKDQVESAVNNTPSDKQTEEFKDDTNNMLLEFMKQAEETRKQELQDAYAREDAIRKETQEREDSAYQRAVADMRKAGINPNLAGISPSASGGGISSASRTEQILGNEITSYTQILQALIEKDTTMSEGDKNRLTQLISSASNLFLFSKLSSK